MREFQNKVAKNYPVINETWYEEERLRTMVFYIQQIDKSVIREVYAFKALLVLTEMCNLWGIDLDKLTNDYD